MSADFFLNLILPRKNVSSFVPGWNPEPGLERLYGGRCPDPYPPWPPPLWPGYIGSYPGPGHERDVSKDFKQKDKEYVQYVGEGKPFCRPSWKVKLKGTECRGGNTSNSSQLHIRLPLWCGPPPKESVGAPDQMTVSQHSKSEGWHPSPLSLLVCSVTCIKRVLRQNVA